MGVDKLVVKGQKFASSNWYHTLLIISKDVVENTLDDDVVNSVSSFAVCQTLSSGWWLR